MERKQVAFVVSEAVPFIKTGGLADVAGALPKALDPQRFEVSVFLPYYRFLEEKGAVDARCLGTFSFFFDGTDREVGVLRKDLDGISWFFLREDSLFSGDAPYAGGREDIRKFLFYDQAVLHAFSFLSYTPEILHCHDWQTGMIPVYVKEFARNSEAFRKIHTVFTIHNLRFRGIWEIRDFQALSGLSWTHFTMEGLEFYGNACMMKGGLIAADAITTVSETYAKEILTPFYGEGLDGVLRKRSDCLTGIVNGIDTDIFNPAEDPEIYGNYSAKNFRQKKKKNKQLLQKELGFPQEENCCLLGMVTRLTDQKGIDLLLNSIGELLKEPVQIVIVGTGEKRYEEALSRLSEENPDRIHLSACYSETMAHKVYAASDLYLMPSGFEPCGLSQLIALRYGAVPLVRETGGLCDTVEPYNRYTGTGTGFSFARYDSEDFANAVRRALELYSGNRNEWNLLVERGMKADFSWKKSAEKYGALYDAISETR